MKIVLLTAQICFVSGGAEMHVNNLKKALEAHGHQVEIVALPFNDNPVERIEDNIVAARLLDIEASWGGPIDLAIGMKFPTYLIPHRNKVMWILHQHRQCYDLFDTEYSNIKNDAEGNRIKDIITNADTRYIAEAKHVFANSRNVANRLKKFNGIDAEPLYHPCPDMEKFYCGKSENYILMPSRINATKRQLLAVQALALTKSDIKLYIAGRSDNPVLKDQINDIVKEHGMEDKVKHFDYVEQEEKFALYANCRGVLFIPKDEDLGYITIEGMASSKPVITAKDSGGPLEFIDDRVTGYICEPEAADIAKAIDELAADENKAVEMGKKAKEKLGTLNMSWDNVVKELLKYAN